MDRTNETLAFKPRDAATPSHCLNRRALRWQRAGCLALGLALGSCVQPHAPFDSVQYLREQYRAHLNADLAAKTMVPFELDAEVIAQFESKVKPSGSDHSRVGRILDFVFTGIDLTYALAPTRNAVETFHTRTGNCLSFVNLFVGLARHLRLNPFYVEVIDHQRWDHREGMVVSQGHIVAGMRIEGELRTYDFLPYRAKAYKDFQPIDDLRAAAHFYNNLGAEALLAGDADRALELLQIAVQIDPAFTKSINNLGVCHARRGELAQAVALYKRGLEIDPTSVPLLSNLARAYQQQGQTELADQLLGTIEGFTQTNPFFFVYRGEMALAAGDLAKALDYMREALKNDSELPDVHLGLVKVYIALGELSKAKHHLERALTLDGTNAEAQRYARMLAGGK